MVNVHCLPFAGGSKYSYFECTKRRDKAMSFIGIDYPGRGSRISEPLLPNIHKIADDAFMKVRQRLHEPYAIFGHSMGAIVGFLLMLRIDEAKLPFPKCLIFSGCPGPSVYKRDNLYTLPKRDFFLHLRNLDGTPPEIFRNDDLMTFFEPILKADFQALTLFRYPEHDKWDIPITVLVGKEEGISAEDAKAWGNETKSQLDLIWFPGKHFFLFNHVTDII